MISLHGSGKCMEDFTNLNHLPAELKVLIVNAQTQAEAVCKENKEKHLKTEISNDSFKDRCRWCFLSLKKGNYTLKKRTTILKRMLSMALSVSVLCTSITVPNIAAEDAIIESVAAEDVIAEEEIPVLEETVQDNAETEPVKENSEEFSSEAEDTLNFIDGGFILESEVITDASMEALSANEQELQPVSQQQLILDGEMALDETVDLISNESYSVSVHYKTKQETHGNETFSSLEAAVSTVNELDPIEVQYHIKGDSISIGNDITFGTSNSPCNIDVHIENQNCVIDLNDNQFIFKQKVELYGENNAVITSSNDEATLVGDVLFNFNSGYDYFTIQNTGSGCAVKGNDVSLSGSVKLISENNHAVYINKKGEKNGKLKIALSSSGIKVVSFSSPLANIYLETPVDVSISYSYNSSIPSSCTWAVDTTVIDQNGSYILIPSDKTGSDPSLLKEILTSGMYGYAIKEDSDGNFVFTTCDHENIDPFGTNGSYCKDCTIPIEASVRTETSERNYPTLKEALEVAEDGDVITLKSYNIELLEPLTVSGKTLTLNLNGKTLTAADINKTNIVNNGGKLFIEDSLSSGRFCVNMEVEEDSQLVIQDGNYYCGSNPITFTTQRKDGITINGGYFKKGIQLTSKNDAIVLNDLLGTGIVYRDGYGKAIYADGKEDTRIYKVSPITANDVTVKEYDKRFTYNGTVQMPDVTISYDSHTLTSDEYEHNIPEEMDLKTAGRKEFQIRLSDADSVFIPIAYEIAKKPLTVESVEVSDRIYNGSDQIALDGVLLNGICGDDQVSVAAEGLTGTLSGSDAGTYDTVTIDNLVLSGNDCDNYEIEVEFPHTFTLQEPVEILQKDISNVSVELDGNLTYNGKEQEQKIKVGQLDGKEITYTVTGNKATEAGEYALTVSGTGNYTGIVEVPYRIEAKVEPPTEPSTEEICNHKFVFTSTIRKATVLKEGLERYKCSLCGETKDKATKVLKPTIKLTATKLPLKVKQSVNLSKLVTGLAAGDSVKSWSLNKTGKSYVTLKKDGTVTGKKSGNNKAKVTVTLASGKTAVITVNVQKKTVKTASLAVTSKNLTLQVGKSTTLKPVIKPITSSQKATYKSSNKKVATVTSGGKVVAKGSGKATITIKSGSKTVKVTVKVPVPELKGIKLSAANKTLKKGKSFTLKATLQPTGAQGKVTYSTSNRKVATVNKNGKVTAKGKGTAKITVKAGKFKVACKIKVN